MASGTCWNCVYVSFEPGRCVRHQPPRCANHPQWPGQLHEVPGVPCRDYQPRPAEPPGDIRRIPLGCGKYALVDAADYEWLNQWRWHSINGYAVRCERGKRIFMHRAIMRAPKGKIVDHGDGNRCNNYRTNLRICTRQDNVHNAAKRAGSSSRYKGVSFCRRPGKWHAQIKFKGHSIHLGYFGDEAEAARAYDRAAVERFGVFARPSFPEDWPVERRPEVHAQWLKANSRQSATRARANKTRRRGYRGHKAREMRLTKRKGRGAASRLSVRRGRKRTTVSVGGGKRR
jgi:hypothetical protein